jgi:predicted GIY-YIG superfamily endonuclease
MPIVRFKRKPPNLTKCKGINIQGKNFRSFYAACAHYKVHHSTARHRVVNLKWTMEQAFELEETKYSDCCEGKVYKITNNVNKKIYIGITTKSLSTRFQGHKHKCLNGGTSKFSVALRLIGSENFKIKLISTTNSKKVLRKLENNYINKYNSIIDGYNTLPGGSSLGGKNGIVVKYKGKTYYSITELARHLKVSPSTLIKRIKVGTPLNNPILPTHGKSIEYEGITYPSISALSKKVGLTVFNTRYRLENSIPLVNFVRGKSILYRGIVYKSSRELGKLLNVDHSLIAYRLKRNYCLNGKPKLTGQKGYYCGKYMDEAS